MMRILLHADEEHDFTKEFADACWQRNLRISPDAWRLSQGWTTGKLWYDGRQHVPIDWSMLHEKGINGVLTSPASALAWQQVLAPSRAACVLGMLVTEPVPLPVGIDFVLWEAPAEADWAAGLLALEEAVAAGQLAGYGVWLAEVTADLTPLWEMAKKAAALAWGRRKRPSWKMLSLPLGLGRPTGLFAAECSDAAGSRISVLEWAARHELMVLARETAIVRLPGGATAPLSSLAPADEIITAVSQLATQEVALIEHLGGWPQRNGAEIFSVLRHLQAGVPLWPGEAAWHAWLAATGPVLQEVWLTLAKSKSPKTSHIILEYINNLQNLARQAGSNGLVVWGAVQWPAVVRGRARGQAEQPWAALADDALSASIIASLPGVTGVLGAWAASEVESLMNTPNLPDVGVIFAR